MESVTRLRRVLAPSALLFLLLYQAGPVSAQTAARRIPGMWVAGGFGIGSGELTCDDCLDGAQAAPTALIGVGYSVSSRLQLALEVSGWVRPISGNRTSIGNAKLVAYFYPLGQAPLSIGVGAGLSRYVTRFSRDGETFKNTLQGLGGSIGVGYDLPFVTGMTISPAVTYHRSLGGKLKLDGEATTLTPHTSVLEFGAVIRWHWATPLASETER